MVSETLMHYPSYAAMLVGYNVDLAIAFVVYIYIWNVSKNGNQARLS